MAVGQGLVKAEHQESLARHGWAYSDTALLMAADISYEAWAEVGGTLQRMEMSRGWWIGDWLLHGERTQGHKYAQAIEELGLQYSTLTNYAHVCRAFTDEQGRPARRRSELSHGHHAAVTMLEPAKQDAYLAQAVKEKWSRQRLREVVAEREGRQRVARPQATPGIEAAARVVDEAAEQAGTLTGAPRPERPAGWDAPQRQPGELPGHTVEPEAAAAPPAVHAAAAAVVGAARPVDQVPLAELQGGYVVPAQALQALAALVGTAPLPPTAERMLADEEAIKIPPPEAVPDPQGMVYCPDCAWSGPTNDALQAHWQDEHARG